MDNQEWSDTKQFMLGSTVVLFIIFIIVGFAMWGCPQYNVYSARMNGQAIEAEAISSKNVAISEARAKKESASLLSEADTIRAHGIARSNQIIGASLKDNKSYLQWLWIDGMEKNKNAVFYIPTETNLPILEASRLTELKKTVGNNE